MRIYNQIANKITRMVKDGYHVKPVYHGKEMTVFRVTFKLPKYASINTNKVLVKDHITCEIYNGDLLISKLFMLIDFVPDTEEKAITKLDEFRNEVIETLKLIAI